MSQNAHFQVDPRLAKLLGENYRSSEQALRGLVDNAFDADADDVFITLPDPLTDFPIIIHDKPLKHSGIAIRVGGKIIGKPTYLDLEQDEHISPKMLKKIYGEIEADGLADDVTADWGAIIENSKAFEVVRNWSTPILREGIEKNFAREISLSKARLQLQIERELAKLPEHRRQAASLALDRVLKKFYGESQDRIDAVISVVIEAFERDEYWVVIQNIEQSDHQDVEAFADALKTFGLMDMASIAQQSARRLKVLDELDDLIRKPQTLEQIIHKVIEKNLWVLGAEYALISSNKTLANVIEDYTNKKFRGDRANKRPDLFLCSSWAGNHLLVEFKRPSHSITRDDATQAEKYRDDLLDTFNRIDVIVVGGRKHEIYSYHNERDDLKVFSYADLISKARGQLGWLFAQLIAERQAA